MPWQPQRVWTDNEMLKSDDVNPEIIHNLEYVNCPGSHFYRTDAMGTQTLPASTPTPLGFSTTSGKTDFLRTDDGVGPVTPQVQGSSYSPGTKFKLNEAGVWHVTCGLYTGTVGILSVYLDAYNITTGKHLLRANGHTRDINTFDVVMIQLSGDIMITTAGQEICFMATVTGSTAIESWPLARMTHCSMYFVGSHLPPPA